MREGSLIFNHIDAEPKYMGFTMLEIITVVTVIVMGLAFNLMILATLGSFASVFVIRYINHLLKISSFKRRVFFFLSDLLAKKCKRLNIYAKYYI